MKTTDTSFSGRNIWEIARSGVFFVLFYFYLWFIVKPELIYHGGGEILDFPVFFSGWAFFNELVWAPGGIVKYISAFLSQYLYISWAGSLVLTLHALGFYVCTNFILEAIGMRKLRIMSFSVPILLLITYNKYTYHFTTTTALLAGLAFTGCYLKLIPERILNSLFLFLVLSAILYFIAGGAYLVFAFICSVFEIFYRRRWLIGVLYLLSAAVLGYVLGVLLFRVSLINAYSDLLPFSWKILYFPKRKLLIKYIYYLYLFLPLIILGGGLWSFFTGRSPLSVTDGSGQEKTAAKAHDINKKKLSEKPYKLYKTRPFFQLKLPLSLETVVLLLITFFLVFSSVYKRRKVLFEVDYYAYKRQWDKILQVAPPFSTNPYIGHNLILALYHLGRLPDDMFNYRLHPRSLILTAPEDISQNWKRINVFYELGVVNSAESELVEALEIHGERPQILKRLALIRLSKGDLSSARIYLGALCKTSIYSEWAKGYLKLLESDPNLTSDREIQRLRSSMPFEDDTSVSVPIERIFSNCLQRNRKNKMAFEYLMAWYMLNKDLEKLVNNIERLNDFNYPRIPRCYEEALLAYTHFYRKRVKVAGYEISGQSQDLFNQFFSTADKYGTNERAAFAELFQKFGNNYYLYYIYALSGATR